ncbi:DUF1700 domain-containing protein [Alkalibacillus aidingensis]|uniref:DUF1700 domain-containing protein n=1 Tax=Alkalibacillus aidingensis TaxID=2747607 RepID=UPI0016605EA3|nr:DUF1700 domain-containing protein [Alkalibacillus aidingensis]
MNKVEYLNELKSRLSSLPEQERDEILYDYEEHFEVALRDGKTELDIINELGSPNKVAHEILMEFSEEQNGKGDQSQTSSNVARMVLLAIALIFINVTFILGPVAAVIGAYFSLYGVVITIGVAPIIALVHLFLYGVGNVFVILFSALFTLSLATLMTVGLIYVGKWMYIGLKKYVIFNIQVVKGER